MNIGLYIFYVYALIIPIFENYEKTGLKNVLSPENLFLYFLTSEGRIWNLVGKFCCQAFQLRKSNVYDPNCG
jgi:hypothetical protein